MEDDHPGTSDDLETHPLNPAAVRRPGGYWNEDSLPVTDWELPDQRIVLPEHLQHRLGPEVPPVLRWARRKYIEVIAKHQRDVRVILRLSGYLDQWQYIGTEPGSISQRVLFLDETGRWYAATVGVDATGSYNLVTVFGGSDRRFLANRLRGLQIVARNEE